MSQEKVKVLIEVSGGCVTNVIAADFVEYTLVDWDNLEAEGIACPECDSGSLLVDPAGGGAEFICEECDCHFVWRTCVDCGNSWPDAGGWLECPYCAEEYEGTRNLETLDDATSDEPTNKIGEVLAADNWEDDAEEW